jgi:hypothetical protein
MALVDCISFLFHMYVRYRLGKFFNDVAEESEAAEFNVNRMSWRIRAARDYSTTNNDDEAPARACSHFS